MSENLVTEEASQPIEISDEEDLKSWQISKTDHLNEKGSKTDTFESKELTKLRNVVAELNNKCETLEKQNVELSEELKKTKLTLQAESEALANKTDDSKELETLKLNTKQLEDDIAALVLERDSLENNLEELDNQHQQAIDKLIQSRDALSAQLRDLTVENDGLKTKLGSSKVQQSSNIYKEQISELQLMIDNLEVQVREKDHQIKTLNNILKVYKENLDPELEEAKTKEAELQKTLDEQIRNEELDKARLMAVLNDKTRENSSLKAEVHRLVSIISAERAALTKVQKDCEQLASAKKDNNEELTKHTVQNLSRLVADKDLEIAALKEKNVSLTVLIQDGSSTSSFMNEIEILKQKIAAYEAEKEQIIAVVNHKHQESINYHSELLKTLTSLQDEKNKFDTLKLQNDELLKKMEEKQMAYLTSQNEAVALQGKLAQMEQLQLRYSRLLQEDNQEKSEIVGDQDGEGNVDVSSTVRVDREDWTAKLKELDKFRQLIQDKDRLLYEKDCLVHEKMRQIESFKEQFKRKEEEILAFNQRLNNLASQLESSRAETMSGREHNANLRSKLEDFRSEIALLKETNSSLSVMLQEREFELKALRGKVETLSRLVEQQRSMSSANREEEEKNNIRKLLKDSEEMRQRAQGFQAERDQTMLALNHKHAEIELMQEQMRAMKEKEERLIREVERFRNHLLHVEESYTQEALAAEEREKDLRTRLALAEDRIQMATSNHSMASQHASLQVESLQEQLRSVMEQRDVALNKSSNLEDHLAQKSAALRTLQVVLEQLQEEKRRDLATYQSQCESALRLQKEECLRLGAELEYVNSQLQDAKEALAAASRLTEQLDRKEETIQMLKEHVEYQESAFDKAKAQIELMRSRSDVTVDKTIVKNLVIGYITVPYSQQKEVLRIIATVLDFNKDERDKTGLDEIKFGWISWLSGKPPVSPSKIRQATQQSLTEAFVRFLESESQPKPKITLPMESLTSSRDSRRKLGVADVSNSNSSVVNHQQNPFVASLMPSNSDSQRLKSDASSNMLMKPMSSALPTFVPLTDRNSTNDILRDVLK
ncbi:thyroid hormone receptor interactor 11 [Chamberlinius hualienensis]